MARTPIQRQGRQFVQRQGRQVVPRMPMFPQAGPQIAPQTVSFEQFRAQQMGEIAKEILLSMVDGIAQNGVPAGVEDLPALAVNLAESLLSALEGQK